LLAEREDFWGESPQLLAQTSLSCPPSCISAQEMGRAEGLLTGAVDGWGMAPFRSSKWSEGLYCFSGQQSDP